MTAGRRPIAPGKILLHLFLPLAAPCALILLYFTPKSFFGCANRGLMALALVTASTAGAVWAILRGTAAGRRGDTEAVRLWFLTMLILLSPLVLLIGPLW
jgi:hypothetical protein